MCINTLSNMNLFVTYNNWGNLGFIDIGGQSINFDQSGTSCTRDSESSFNFITKTDSELLHFENKT